VQHTPKPFLPGSPIQWRLKPLGNPQRQLFKVAAITLMLTDHIHYIFFGRRRALPKTWSLWVAAPKAALAFLRESEWYRAA
jgi:hypothetical protein